MNNSERNKTIQQDPKERITNFKEVSLGFDEKLMLAEAAEKGVSYQPELIYDRHQVRKKREKNEIGIHSVRGGNIVGEHEVMFAGPEEIVTLSHSASSRDVFARGAVKAAVFMKGRPAGMYDMQDVINESV